MPETASPGLLSASSSLLTCLDVLCSVQVVEVLPSASAFAVNDVVVEGSAQMPRWQVPISSPQPPVQYSLSSKQMLIVDSPKSRSIARHTLNCSTTIMSALSRASSSDSELLVAAATSATSPGAGSSGTKPRRRTTPALDKSKVTDADIDDNPDAIDTARVVILRPGRRSSHNVTPRPKSCCSTPSVKQCLGSLTQRRDSQPGEPNTDQQPSAKWLSKGYLTILIIKSVML